MSEGKRTSDLYYRVHVFCCTNDRGGNDARPSCAQAGSVGLRDYMKARSKAQGLKDVRINSAGCLDRCEEGPSIVIYPEGVWYRADSRADIDEIITEHLQGGRIVPRLLMAGRA